MATRTAAEGASDWVDGETALECCPPGFVGGAGGLCNVGTSGTTPVVRCGDADAEENENVVYTAGSWPATVSARVTALQLRYQPTDLGQSSSATGTGSAGSSRSPSNPGSENGSGGLSVGAKAAVGTVIPLAFLLGALAALLLWRRRKQRERAAALSKNSMGGHETKHSYEEVQQHNFTDSKGTPAVAAPMTRNGLHETPEWNVELDATEAERRRYMAVQGSLFPPGNNAEAAASSPGGASEASELGGMIRVNRKPVAPVELDSTPLTAELNGSGNDERR